MEQWIGFAFRTLAKFALLMAAVSVVVFVLVSASPIDPVQANVGQAAYVGMSYQDLVRWIVEDASCPR